MKEWVLSRYTSVIYSDYGDILLHNGFMGSIALIPAHRVDEFAEYFIKPVKESDLSNPGLKELCDGGFFVLANLDEKKIVYDILEKEGNYTFSTIILVHENCNFRCIYCYEKFEHGRIAPDVATGLKALIERKAKKHKRICVAWFGGEPLLAKEAIYDLSRSFIDSCAENGIPYLSSISTNGYLLDPDVVDTLLACQVKTFQVTLDGPEQVHNEKRKLASGEGTYKKILDNLALMKKRNDDFHVRIRINFHAPSVPFLEQWLFDEMVPFFANDPRFSLMFFPIYKWSGVNDNCFDVVDNAVASEINQEFISGMGFSNKLAKEFLKPHGNVCFAGKKSSIIVRADGTLYKRTIAFDDPNNNLGKLSKDGRLLIDKKRWKLWVDF